MRKDNSILLYTLYSLTKKCLFKLFNSQSLEPKQVITPFPHVLPPEYSRYLHSHLDIPVAEYNVDQDLPGNFKNHWAKNLPFLIEDYEEQPGLQPHIKCVLCELSTAHSYFSEREITYLCEEDEDASGVSCTFTSSPSRPRQIRIKWRHI